MLIVLTGRARTGKDTLGKFLQDNFKGNYFIMAYADELKRRCMRDFDLSNEQTYGELKEVPDERYPREDGSFWTPREILQHIGTESYRAIDEKFWIKQLFKYIDRNNLKNVIITDARFGDEIKAVTSRGGICVKLERDNVTKISGEEHISETALDNFYNVDFLIKNNGAFSELEEKAKLIVKEIEDNGR